MPSEARSLPAIEPDKPLPREYWPDESQIVTEDGKPVDNLYSLMLMQLLRDSLSASWLPPDGSRRFLAAGNVGVFSNPDLPPLVPDFFVSIDVEPPTAETIGEKEGRSYFIWRHGKPPDIVIECVSNREGDELTRKLAAYARMKVTHYVVWDPYRILGDDKLTVFELHGNSYRPSRDTWFPELGLGIVPWFGTFHRVNDEWLRWCDADGNILPTGHEKALETTARADQLAAEVERLRSLLHNQGTETP